MASPIFQMRLDPQRRERWQAAADERGMKLAEYVKACVDVCSDDATLGEREPQAVSTPASARAPSSSRSPSAAKKTYAPDPK